MATASRAGAAGRCARVPSSASPKLWTPFTPMQKPTRRSGSPQPSWKSWWRTAKTSPTSTTPDGNAPMAAEREQDTDRARTGPQACQGANPRTDQAKAGPRADHATDPAADQGTGQQVA